jgi:3-isopropylmalate dehydrogenase
MAAEPSGPAGPAGAPSYRLGVLTGDGIGPEIVPAAVAAVDAAAAAENASVEWLAVPMGHEAIASSHRALPEDALDLLASTDGWLLGPHDSVSYPPALRAELNPSAVLRKHFDLFANIRPARTLVGVPAVVERMDLVIVRENTEGFYADRNTYRGSGEWMPVAGVAVAQGVFTRGGAERVARAGYELARQRRGHLTVVHKSNVLRLTTGMYQDVVYELAAEYPDVAVDDAHIDAMAAHLVRRPADFDVIVTENMFGDILSDLTGALSGSLGLAASLNASRTTAMAQAAHGAAPDIAGRGIANPVAMILSAAMLLDWLGGQRQDPRLTRAGRHIDAAVTDTLASGIATPDLGGQASTSEFAEAVVSRVASVRTGKSGMTG